MNVNFKKLQRILRTQKLSCTSYFGNTLRKVSSKLKYPGATENKSYKFGKLTVVSMKQSTSVNLVFKIKIR